MVRVIWFIKVKNWKDFKCLVVGEVIKKLWESRIVKYFLVKIGLNY